MEITLKKNFFKSNENLLCCSKITEVITCISQEKSAEGKGFLSTNYFHVGY